MEDDDCDRRSTKDEKKKLISRLTEKTETETDRSERVWVEDS